MPPAPTIALQEPPTDPAVLDTEATAAAIAQAEKTANRQIRGSSLLMSGRMISIGINYVVQILTVRYLSESAYGAFAYALSMATLAETFVTFGLDRAVTRFLPIYEEQKNYGKLFGTYIMVLSTILSLSTALLLLVFSFQNQIAQSLVNDQQAISLLLILIVLGPIQALDNVFEGILAVFSRPRAIFFRRYVVAPALKVAVVGMLILGQSGVEFLAVGYVGAGLLGVLVYGSLLVRLFREHELSKHFNRAMVKIPVREVLAFTVPLLASDLVYVVMNTVDAIMLEAFHSTSSVAAFRAVQPTARFNQLILTSFALLFTPAAARLFARQDWSGINKLYWQNAIWVAVLSFPIFAMTFSLAQPLTTFIFDVRYADSGVILALLSFGYYFNAATGQNGLTLKVTGRIRYIVIVDVGVAVLNLLLNLVLIPRYGALGAAVGTTVTMIIFNILKQYGLSKGTGVHVFERRYVRVYAVIGSAALGLLLVQAIFSPHVLISIPIALVTSLLVVRLNRGELDIQRTYPQLMKIKVLRLLLS